MSGADELDEAIALANSHRAGPGYGPAASRTPASPAPARPADRPARPRPGDPVDAALRLDEPAAGRAKGRTARGSSAETPRTPEDELDAPAWLTAPSTGAHPYPEPPQPVRESPDAGADDPGARTWDQAHATAAHAVSPLPSVTLPLDQALRHTLAEPLEALTDLPSFDTSAMDGWAVSGPGPWELTEDEEAPGILAGDRREPGPLSDGQAVRIATGARTPPGTSAVLRSEAASLRHGRLHTHRPPQPGTDIRQRGQECRTGDLLLPEGSPLTPAALGLAAAAGYDEITAVRRPRVEVLVLGDELLHQGLPREGRIRDALGPMVGPWLEALGAQVLSTRRLGDDAEALHEAVTGTEADLVVTTGGTASGPVDHLHPTLERIGARLLVDGVRVRPGHPMLLAELPVTAPPGKGRGRKRTVREAEPPRPAHLVGLPGNPLAALSGLVTLAAPLLHALAHRPAADEPWARLDGHVQPHPRDTRLVPVAYSPAESLARPLHYTGPAMLRGIATATALAVVPPGGSAPDGDVQLLTLPW
ncbi:molybdopterin molybdotransferase MoeA [Streptomyces sp. HNM0574]|uniref:molybdopterin molybdotransferase MoeA n=1 Tax=Streptomyces sp. HNM0574 TaxID=2714954 RepID=UPI00146B40C0|nr:molybdopterin molybdotransferase MoeA [Streptomyces sp. HNM0574]NLU68645.1 molybdopterin molybdenumtransferase MoeA [Streptomyces sp. HNM0574]